MVIMCELVPVSRMIFTTSIMSRILYENMGFFNLAFDGVVDWHQFYDEMSTK